MRKIEICCTTLSDVRHAALGGACRIELCASLTEGGVTPSAGVIKSALEINLPLKIHVLIRPRGGNFVYSDDEIKTMLEDIKLCGQLGVDGIVIGALTHNGDIDIATMQQLIGAATPTMSITFHRAFDVCCNPFHALEEIISLGCHRILSSGQQPSAKLGTTLLKQLVEQANGRIIIMPGCGVTPQNINTIEQLTQATEFHSTARSAEPAKHTFTNPNVSFGEDKLTLCTNSSVVAMLVGE